GVTIDQIAARHLGKNTTMTSLALCGEPGGSISYRTATQPLPLETNPRKVFYSMFGQGDTQRERIGILKTTDSLLDSVRESAARPEISHRGFREICRAPQEHARWRWVDARPFDHSVRQQHGQQRRAQCRSASADDRWPRRRYQGWTAPALSAGHSTRKSAGHN